MKNNQQIQSPLISVIIPVFNGELFIAEAIQSVLDQQYHPLEIIIVDDGSTDKTAQVVQQFDENISYIYQENAGISASRNKGLELAKGEFITFIDADDVWVKNKLQIQMDYFKNKPHSEVVYGFLLETPMLDIDRLYRINMNEKKGFFATQLGCMLIKREVFNKVGNFDLEMIVAEDLDWVHRIREASINVLAHKEIVQFYRAHDHNITKDKKRIHSYMLKAYKKSLDRRRASGSKSVLPFPKLKNIEDVLNYWQNK